MQYINQLKLLFEQSNANGVALSLRHKPELTSWVTEQTQQYAPLKHIMEGVYIVLNGPPPYCEYGNKRQFKSFNLGYRNGCIKGNKCKCVGKIRKEKQKQTMLERYGVDDANFLQSVVEKRKQTMLKRYGVEFASQSKIIMQKQQESKKKRSEKQKTETKLKTQNTMLQKYGVTHHMKNTHQQQKVKDTTKERHGFEFPLQNVDSKIKFKNSVAAKTITEKQLSESKRKTSLTKKYGVVAASRIGIDQSILDILDDKEKFKTTICGKTRAEALVELKIHYHTLYLYAKKYDVRHLFAKTLISQFESEVLDYIKTLTTEEVISSDKSILEKQELDIFIPTLNIAIECCGIYWHAELSSNRKKNYHYNKFNECNKKGIKLITIFDNDWKENPEIIKARLKNAIQTSTPIYARKCVVKQIEKAEANGFIKKYHLQGTITSDYQFGLYFDNVLMSVMTFGKSRYNKKYQFELLRFCSSQRVIGGASKLFKGFIKTVNPTSVVTYSDNCWGAGSVYEKLGFVFIKETIGYNYTTYNNKLSRIQFQKHKIKQSVENGESKTEWEIMQELGYDRIWDCGQKTWSYQKVNN